MLDSFSVKINKPCAENWRSLTPQANGRFCHSCVKQVIDFTSMTNQEIFDFFKHNNSNVCGRLSTAQVGTQTLKPVVSQRVNATWIQAGVMGMLLTLTTRQSIAQCTNSVNANPSFLLPENNKIVAIKEDSTRFAIRGMVIDSLSKEPIIGAVVAVKGSTRATLTDIDGLFVLSELRSGDVLVISYCGFEEVQFPVKNQYQEIFKFYLKEENTCSEIMGEVAFDQIYQEESSRFNKLWTKLKDLF